METIILTIITQISSALINNIKGNQHARELSERQQKLDENILEQSQENSRNEFVKLCQLQREIEMSIHEDRIDQIVRNQEESNKETAYAKSLENWPMFVPPYIIKNDFIFGLKNNGRMVSIPLNCIVSPSSDNKFNTKVFPRLEEEIADFCYRYWNVSSSKGIRFYQKAWRDTSTGLGSKHHNLWAHLKDVPTLVIAPEITDEKLIFKFYWWGISTNPEDDHYNKESMFDPQLSFSIQEDKDYPDEEVNEVLSELVPKLEAFLSCFADTYYWKFYHKIPSLPALFTNHVICINNDDTVKGYKDVYKKFLNEYCKSTDCITQPSGTSLILFSLIQDFLNGENDTQESFEKYIEIKRKYGALNCSEVPLLEYLGNIDGISSSYKEKIETIATELAKEEEGDYRQCAGRNELFQNFHDICKEMDSSSIYIHPIDKKSSIACVASDGKPIYNSMGVRFYLFTHPLYTIEDDSIFEQESCELIKANQEDSIIKVLRNTHMSEVLNDKITENENFIKKLKSTFEEFRRRGYAKELSNSELFNVKYSDVKTIARDFCCSQIPKYDKAEEFPVDIELGYSCDIDRYLLLFTMQNPVIYYDGNTINLVPNLEMKVQVGHEFTSEWVEAYVRGHRKENSQIPTGTSPQEEIIALPIEDNFMVEYKLIQCNLIDKELKNIYKQYERLKELITFKK